MNKVIKNNNIYNLQKVNIKKKKLKLIITSIKISWMSSLIETKLKKCILYFLENSKEKTNL